MTDEPDIAHDPGDLEDYAGEVTPDPWEDDEQPDWPTETVDPDA